MSTAIIEFENKIEVIEVAADHTAQAPDEYGKLVSVDELYLSGKEVWFEGCLIATLPGRPASLAEAFEAAHEAAGLLSVRVNGATVWSWEAVLARRAAVQRAKERAAEKEAKAKEKAEKEAAKAKEKAEKEWGRSELAALMSADSNAAKG